MLNCNGKCYLAKQLEKVEQQEQKERNEFPSPKQKIEKVEHLLFITDNVSQIQLMPFYEMETRGGLNKSMFSQPHISSLKHPPQVVLFTS